MKEYVVYNDKADIELVFEDYFFAYLIAHRFKFKMEERIIG